MSSEEISKRNEIEARKKKAERGWLADSPPRLPDFIDRYFKETPEQRAEGKAARDRRYGDLMNKPRDWIADPTKNRKNSKGAE